jgi:hypothetical protein
MFIVAIDALVVCSISLDEFGLLHSVDSLFINYSLKL